MAESESFRLARSNIEGALERSGGTIASGLWSGILMLAEDEEDEDRFVEVAQSWRRARGLPEIDDFVVGDLAP